ncbi:hypothetical protein DFP72DRAFT_456179 [Ephemerocybe angulata]|uniref:Uncharacterized protein n=1 Tax=Ephemerocybe angulata TaxID=980116 RepID=A0A8H6HUN6_9AGAR|nr:hypothetical protein DFP72DRAFT_456179 [Tulosesus angulatus]
MDDHRDHQDRDSNNHGSTNKKPPSNLTLAGPKAEVDTYEGSEFHIRFRQLVKTPIPPPISGMQSANNTRGLVGSASASDAPNSGRSATDAIGSVKAKSKAVENPKFNFRAPPFDTKEFGFGNKKRKRDEDERGGLRDGKSNGASDSRGGSGSKTSSAAAQFLTEVLPGFIPAKLARSNGAVRTEEGRESGGGGNQTDDREGHSTRRRKTDSVKVEHAIIDLSSEVTKRPKVEQTDDGNALGVKDVDHDGMHWSHPNPKTVYAHEQQQIWIEYLNRLSELKLRRKPRRKRQLRSGRKTQLTLRNGGKLR